MDSISSIPQRPVYTLPVQVMSAAAAAAAAAIILTQPLTNIGLIVLYGMGGANIAAFAVATVIAGRYSKLEKEAAKRRSEGESIIHKVSGLEKIKLPPSIEGLYAGIESLFRGLIGAACKSRGEEAKPSEERFAKGFAAIKAIIGLRSAEVTETKKKEPLIPILVSAHNFGSDNLFQEVKDDINGTLETKPLTKEQRERLIARTIISFSMVIDLLKVLLTMEGEACRKELDRIHLQLAGLVGVADYLNSKKQYCELIDLQIQNKQKVYLLGKPEKKEEVLSIIQKIYKKAKVNEKLSTEELVAIECPVEESPIKPLTRVPKSIIFAALTFIKPLIPKVIEKILIDGGFADKDDPRLETIKGSLPEVLIPFLQNAYLKDTPFRKKFAQVLKEKGDGWVRQLENLPSEKKMEETPMIEGFQQIIQNVINNLN